MKKIEGWTAWTFIGSLTFIAFLINGGVDLRPYAQVQRPVPPNLLQQSQPIASPQPVSQEAQVVNSSGAENQQSMPVITVPWQGAYSIQPIPPALPMNQPKRAPVVIPENSPIPQHSEPIAKVESNPKSGEVISHPTNFINQHQEEHLAKVESTAAPGDYVTRPTNSDSQIEKPIERHQPEQIAKAESHSVANTETDHQINSPVQKIVPADVPKNDTVQYTPPKPKSHFIDSFLHVVFTPVRIVLVPPHNNYSFQSVSPPPNKHNENPNSFRSAGQTNVNNSYRPVQTSNPHYQAKPHASPTKKK